MSVLDAFDIPSAKVPISVTTFVSYVVPLVASYILAAILALTPQTRAFRIALWPIVAFLAFRASASVDLSQGQPDLKSLNVELVRFAICISAHTFSWALAKKPLVRHLRPANDTPSTIKDALDLVTTLRGYGWDWSRGLHVAIDTRPTNRIAFAFYALVSSVWNGFLCSACHRLIHAFTRDFGLTPSGPSVFDDTLPFFVRYFRASIISILAVLTTYSGVQLTYNALTVLGVLIFRQDPAQWPPAFDKPWMSTSLSDLWSRRWHQNFRHTLIVSAYPFYLVFGRVGGIFGAFLASGLIHHIMMVGFGGQLEPWRMLVGFGMMAPGIVAERAYYKWTGRKVGGLAGWIWTMSWFLAWGVVIAEGFLKVGMFGQPRAMDSESAVWVSIANGARGLDLWLHGI